MVVNVAQGSMGLSQIVFEFDRLPRAFFCFWKRLPRRDKDIRGHHVSVGLSSVSQCEARIFFNRLLIETERLLEIVFGDVLGVVAPLPVKIVSLEILRWLLVQTLLVFAEKTDLQRLGHLLCHFAPDRKDVLHLAIISVRPKMITVRGLDELGGDAQFVAGPGDAAFEQMTYMQ